VGGIDMQRVGPGTGSGAQPVIKQREEIR